MRRGQSRDEEPESYGSSSRASSEHPASQSASSGAARRDPNAPEAGRYLYPFFEDLTRINFDKMRAIASHPSVQSCWSAGGVIRFKLKNSDSIRKVKCVFSDLQDILKG
jgi:hypothetical protein